ncbi:hypothetical protein C8R46DRAFT_1116321 [Mycena filopes]|nr:hypothetical protein C8R46DRAFT_1116321 [Mycena filopes]
MSDLEYDELGSDSDGLPAVGSLVDQMIRDTAREIGPDVLRKWTVSTPATMRKAKSNKRAAREDSPEPSGSRKTAPRKKSKKVIDIAGSDSEPDNPVTKLVVYILIPKNVPAGTVKRRGKAAVPEPLQKGPFELLSSDTYHIFLSKIAKTLPCLPENIHETKIQWKPKKPNNAPTLSLGKETGYKAMLDEMVAKKVDARTILLTMPAPAEPMEEETPWPKADDNNTDKKRIFDYSELEAPGPSDSIHQQQVRRITL